MTLRPDHRAVHQATDSAAARTAQALPTRLHHRSDSAAVRHMRGQADDGRPDCVALPLLSGVATIGAELTASWPVERAARQLQLPVDAGRRCPM